MGPSSYQPWTRAVGLRNVNLLLVRRMAQGAGIAVIGVDMAVAAFTSRAESFLRWVVTGTTMVAVPGWIARYTPAEA